MTEIWEKRMVKDFPFILTKLEKLKEASDGNVDFKKEYIELFSRFSKRAETFTESILEDYGKLAEFLKPEFKVLLYNHFYDLCITAVKNVLKEDYEDEDVVFDSVPEIYYNRRFDTFRTEYFPKPEDENFAEYWQDAIVDVLRAFVKEILSFIFQ